MFGCLRLTGDPALWFARPVMNDSSLNSGFTFGLAEGGHTELAVLDSAPNDPLVRAVYLGRLGRGS